MCGSAKHVTKTEQVFIFYYMYTKWTVHGYLLQITTQIYNTIAKKLSDLLHTIVIVMERERITTIAITLGLFGGLVGGPIASLAYYYASPQDRFRLFIIPEFIGFACLGLMVYCRKLRKKGVKDD